MTELEKQKAAAKKLYAGKTFYVKNPDGTLDGPRDDIYYAVRYYKNLGERIKALYHFVTGVKPYKFVQVINGIPRQAFTEDDIVVKVEVQDGK